MKPEFCPHRAVGAVVVAATSLVLFAGGNLAGAASRIPGNALPAATGTPQPYPLSNGGRLHLRRYGHRNVIAYPSATPSSSTSTSTESYVYECPVTFNEVSNLCDELGADSQGDVLDGFQGAMLPEGQRRSTVMAESTRTSTVLTRRFMSSRIALISFSPCFRSPAANASTTPITH